jgi:hypothetical protein
VDNELYIPGLNTKGAVTAADWRVLLAMAKAEGGRILDAPTVGEILQGAGRVMASAGSGSPGTTYLTNPTLSGPVVNWAVAWPEEICRRIEKLFGSFLGPDSTSFNRNDFILKAVREILIPVYNPDLLTIWITEPDHTQHRCGLGSPETKAALNRLDEQLEDFTGVLERTCHGEDYTIILLSDHGFSTVSETVSPKEELAAAGLIQSPEADDIIVASNSIYLRKSARERLAEVARILRDRPWTGVLFLRDDLTGECPGFMPQSSVFNFHRRSAEILLSYQWSLDRNNHSVPGSAQSASRFVATHGSSSPYDMNNCLVAWGKGIRQGVISETPCGIVDVAPTVLHLLGIEIPRDMDGRVLNEILEGDASPEAAAVSREIKKCIYSGHAGEKCQTVQISRMNRSRYLDQATVTPLRL